jgi:hypothetical protein
MFHCKNKISIYYKMTTTNKCNNCGCNYISCCRSCSYKSPNTIPPLEYQYWNETIWLQQATVNHWGAFNGGSTNNGNNTGDNSSGYGISSSNTSPNSKKLKRFYSYDTFISDNPSKLIFYNNLFIAISELPDVKIFYRWVSV